MPSESELNDRNSASRARQQISRRNRSELRFVRNLEKQALNTTGNSARRREIRGAADDMRAIISARTTDERGKLEEGIIYDSKQYARPTFNSDGTTDKATDDEGIDSINSESTPGNSQGGASGGVPNDNSTPPPEDPDDGSLRPNDWYSYANEGNQDLVFGTPGARGSVNSLQINYTGLAFKCTDANGGFNIQNPSGNALINVFMQDLPDTVSDTDPAKFRSILVCKDDELKEIYVLSTKPEDPA
jgi:hypothetical protein